MLKKQIFWFVCGAVGLGLMGASQTKKTPRLIYNPTDSAPIGWYQVLPNKTWNTGDTVAAWLPESAENLAIKRGYLPSDIPILKTVFAGPGEEYCIQNGELVLDGIPPFAIQSTDSKEMVMPVLSGGCRRLKEREYLLLSDSSATSFDSRYFGPVTVDLIIGQVRFLGNDRSLNMLDAREKGGTRGRGAEGKIKEGGAIRGITPCLHINFYSAVTFRDALPIPGNPNSHRSWKQRYFTDMHACARTDLP